jgi:hypothetical protein
MEAFRRKHQDLGELRVSRRVAGIELDRLAQQAISLVQRHLPPVADELPGGQIAVIDLRRRDLRRAGLE